MPLLWLLITGSLAFTLPAHEGGDNCGEAVAPCTDLDSVYLYRQDVVLYPRPTVIKRAGVRGMEGAPWSFSYSCDGTCQYYVTTRDLNGNESCPSRIVQIGGAVSVPPPPVLQRPALRRWVDVQGRRMQPGPQGWYGRAGADTLVIR